ncbi:MULTISPECIES: ATP/GTP-binding protein [unclassified Nodosilinea]|uniref:ATP/GTP-binding protein n=1 Tax=Leptolyngbya subtilissima DQ-A4 TaxID=2933933 RepID=A0ABV0K1C1_9CYAN|nr:MULTISPECIES: ATP/GTP-binding protein [unclassified Nodosilinea]MBD2108983.1 ATP/GTP-binding protein [Nodosilinea sp. FACHB-13]MBD2111058.1 ATP/GTP-binding protein [Nodosilinea sp. FACHB-141]
MEIMRLVVTGPVGAGKSTFIRSVSEIEVVDTDRRATDDTLLIKKRTTVAFDFGRLQFGPDMALHLYGTPGQSRFDFMWDILIQKAHAYILLVAAHRPHEFREARRIMTFMKQRSPAPMIIGLTHTDCSGAWDAANIALALGYPDPARRPPIVAVNANETASVAQAVISLVQFTWAGSLAPTT